MSTLDALEGTDCPAKSFLMSSETSGTGSTIEFTSLLVEYKDLQLVVVVAIVIDVALI